MSWRIEVKPAAEKQYRKLDKRTRARIKESLLELEKMKDPFQHKHVRPLTGELRGDWRMRVGNWRILFTPHKESKNLCDYAILPRGDSYE